MVGALDRILDVADHSVYPGERRFLDTGGASTGDDHLCVDARGVAGPGRGHRPVLAQGRGWFDGTTPNQHVGL